MATKMNFGNDSSNSCVETPDAPEWLSKLEDRREKLKFTKLGHELGAGAPCNECGSNCPGLDLHFWRKVCRNCKCRKDQHMCSDDDLSGWAQFHILGQIRSKPAYIKIKALANQPIQLEWVPPNVTTDVVTEYMDKLGTSRIPVLGSNAALKRKQQLEFQVPPHDLDPKLCDNLTEGEEKQLQQYVEKIRNNWVGQGNVVRIGSVSQVIVRNFPTSNVLTLKYTQAMAILEENPIHDPVLEALITNDSVIEAVTNIECTDHKKLLIAFKDPFPEPIEDMKLKSELSESTQQKLVGINNPAIKSFLRNKNIYNKLLDTLKVKNYDVSQDPRLGPIAAFQAKYANDSLFKEEIDKLFNTSGNLAPSSALSVNPINKDLTYSLQLPVKSLTPTRDFTQCYEYAPQKKHLHDSSALIYKINLPAKDDYKHDKVSVEIFNSETLSRTIQGDTLNQPSQVMLSLSPGLQGNLDDLGVDMLNKRNMQSKISNANVIKMIELNGSLFDRLVQIIGAVKNAREELFLKSSSLGSDICELMNKCPIALQICSCSHPGIPNMLPGSKSTDSGFGSDPSTPNHCMSAIPCANKLYSSMEPKSNLPEVFQNLNMNNDGKQDQIPFLECHDCRTPINFGEIAVKAERAGTDIAWHPECFKCYICRELLADLVYFFHDGNVYCGRDLAISLKIPRCKACDELIFTKEYTAAEGTTFHIKHFCCYQCDLPLAGQQYIPDDQTNMPLCLTCYNKHFAKECQLCRCAIGPSDQGVAWGDIHWHDTCFICAGPNCRKSLIGGKFCVKQNMPFCCPTCVHSMFG